MAAGSLWVTQECEFLPSQPWALSHGMCAFKLFLTCWPEHGVSALKVQFAGILGRHVQPGRVPWSPVGFREESAQHLIVWGFYYFALVISCCGLRGRRGQKNQMLSQELSPRLPQPTDAVRGDCPAVTKGLQVLCDPGVSVGYGHCPQRCFPSPGRLCECISLNKVG